VLLAGEATLLPPTRENASVIEPGTYPRLAGRVLSETLQTGSIDGRVAAILMPWMRAIGGQNGCEFLYAEHLAEMEFRLLL
jgi:hypothetical protein